MCVCLCVKRGRACRFTFFFGSELHQALSPSNPLGYDEDEDDDEDDKRNTGMTWNVSHHTHTYKTQPDIEMVNNGDDNESSVGCEMSFSATTERVCLSKTRVSVSFYNFFFLFFFQDQLS